MASAPPSNVTPELVVLALFLYLIARRTVRQIQGARYSVGQLAVFAGLYVLLFAALAFTTLYAAAGAWGSEAYPLLAAYVAVPVAAAYFAAPYVERVVRFERRDDGQWYYRLSWHVPVLYLVLFTARIAAEIAVFGLGGIVITLPPPAPPSVGAVYILIGVDLMFGVSLGLLVGRGIGVYRAHRDHLQGPGSAPPPSPPLLSG